MLEQKTVYPCLNKIQYFMQITMTLESTCVFVFFHLRVAKITCICHDAKAFSSRRDHSTL